MSQKSVLRIIYSLFWAAVLIVLGVSLHLGLNATFVWYVERQSFNTYLAYALLAMLILAATLALAFLQRKRFLRMEARLRNRRIEEFPADWRGFLPVILMSLLFLVCSLFGLLTLQDYLLPNYKINAVLVIFTGSLSKIAVGLLVVIAFRTGLRRTASSVPVVWV